MLNLVEMSDCFPERRSNTLLHDLLHDRCRPRPAIRSDYAPGHVTAIINRMLQAVLLSSRCTRSGILLGLPSCRPTFRKVLFLWQGV